MLADGRVSIRSRSWNFYVRPETDEFAREVLNPYTGSMVPSAPMLGPSREQIYSIDGLVREGVTIPLEVRKPSRSFDLKICAIGDRAFVGETNFVRFQPRDIDWHKPEGTLWSHSCLLDDLRSVSLTHIPISWSQNLVAEWQTWMNMHGSPGAYSVQR